MCVVFLLHLSYDSCVPFADLQSHFDTFEFKVLRLFFYRSSTYDLQCAAEVHSARVAVPSPNCSCHLT